MSGTHARPALASYRDDVTELIEAGVPFGDVEDAIDVHARLTEDEKAALWLFAFSLRDQSEQQHDARAHLTALQAAAGGGVLNDSPPLGRTESRPRSGCRAEVSDRRGWFSSRWRLDS